MTGIQLYLALGIAWGVVLARYVYRQMLAPTAHDQEMAALNNRLRRDHPLWTVRLMFASVMALAFVAGVLAWAPMVTGALIRLVERRSA